ncbi:hypothetical protein PYW08_006870 [Mythimna loreyi]|uniref:Uncharacterized protein n=1 Tax=Mythimna loreyi TaxID=667449 RepID=A0ACC2R845_9NEOP|nr:hypothetical protein PYW08_006870 [Mythimna loreyi]
MPQSRFRNEVSYDDETPQSTYAERASGDSTPCAVNQNQDSVTRSQDKLPRSVRYELEKALIGLCDVWFDEIKPHLVRNNIKLHINGGSCSASGDQGGAVCAAHERREPPVSPPPPSALSDACSHLDPASSPDCKLCQLLVTTASCIERAASEASYDAPMSPLSCDFYASDASGWSSDSDTQL